LKLELSLVGKSMKLAFENLDIRVYIIDGVKLKTIPLDIFFEAHRIKETISEMNSNYCGYLVVDSIYFYIIDSLGE
jgi:hypothetical protein